MIKLALVLGLIYYIATNNGRSKYDHNYTRNGTVVFVLAIAMPLLFFVGCTVYFLYFFPGFFPNAPEIHDFNYDTIEEMVENYISEKYGVNCEITHIANMTTINHANIYVQVRFKISDDDNEYLVFIHPETYEDTDSDGYYDSYYVESDDYMCAIVNPLFKNEMNSILSTTGINNYISLGSISQQTATRGFQSDFPIPQTDNFSIKDVPDLDIYYSVYIPESEYSDELETIVREAFAPFFDGSDYIVLKFYVYTDDEFEQVIEHYNTKGFIGGNPLTVYEFSYMFSHGKIKYITQDWVTSEVGSYNPSTQNWVTSEVGS